MERLVISMIMLLLYLPSIGQTNPGDSLRPFLLGKQADMKGATVNNIEKINSDYHDYCPIILPDGILFTSDRTNRGDADFYFSASNVDGDPLPPLPFEEMLNSDYQEGMAAMSPDQKTIVFSRDASGLTETNGFSDVRLFIAEKNNGLWASPKKMAINLKDFSSGHPCFSPDGKRLYFVSNRPDSYGGTDIYVSEKKRNGKWGKPKNLGPRINSPRNELFVSTDKNENLYFSSNRSDGLGLLDIYVAERVSDKIWGKPQNVGAPINSTTNDFGVFVDDDAFYFSSDRAGGKGGNDIYYYGTTKSGSSKLLSLDVKVNDKTTNTPIKNAKVSIIKNDNVQDWTVTNEKGEATLNFMNNQKGYLAITHAEYPEFNYDLVRKKITSSIKIDLEKVTCISMTGQLTNTSGQELRLVNVPVRIMNLSTSVEEELVANADGSFEFCLPCNSDFSIKAYAENYYCEDLSITTKNLSCTNEEFLKIQVPVSAIVRSEEEGISSNMTSTSNQDSLALRNEKNKTYLESISVAEAENEVETEVDFIPDSYESTDLETIKTESTKAEDVTLVNETNSKDFSNIYFDFDSYDLDIKDKVYLDNLAQHLKSNSTLKIEVQSYTDPRGTKAYNKWLAKRRAESIVEYMLEVGVELNRIKANPQGEIQNSKDFANARRAELMIAESVSEINAINNEADEIYVSQIYYDFDDFRLNELSESEVKKVYDKLSLNPSLVVEVRSHTDARGSTDYNQWLSQKRANEVVRQIVKMGIDKKRLRAKGFGESELVNDCADESNCSKEDHAMNRRTEFVFE